MAALTKKQQKSLAFKAGKGKKDREQPADLPEEDVLPNEDEPAANEDEQESAEYKAKSKSKKSKEKKLKEKLAKEGAGESLPKEKSEKAKGKEKEIVKDGEQVKTGEPDAEEGKKAKKTKKDVKQRFILFVGHMSYDTTAAGLATHFEKEIGTKPSVRLLTTKGTPATMYHKASESRSRGIAFVEFASSGALQAGLRLHHTELDGKLINVELTAGGGGGTDDRKQKIAERNERIGEQRKRKREADGTEDGEKEAGGDAAEGEEGSDKKKARGGRCGKKTGNEETGPALAPEDDPKKSGWAARKAGTFATEGSGPPPRDFGGRGGRGGGGRGQSRGRGGSSSRGRGGGGGGDRRKWEPTGANAMVVG
ncbi:hypothetical protein QFC22_000332 [Naganishia vaughanmartiniae]|uniref:Uncharacterized protein n=1 Tax=Naganishia vaughanmartiniae TaxID=1424756 RepID=A0ACC2XRQ0_9TREE|nr:hypothetical protein QFC22_000332 [Naganishia vaughanmartiniae]